MRPFIADDGAITANTQWYALHVRSKSEYMVSAGLRGKGYEEFLPVYRSRRRWSDREKELEAPLFPGYIFCRFDPAARLLPILTTPGVSKIVGAGKSPVPISEAEIAAVQMVLRSGLAARPYPFLTIGTRVYIERGPLTGLEGTITTVNKKERLVLSVPLLQRSLAVEIDRDWVRAAPNRKVQPETLATNLLCAAR